MIRKAQSTSPVNIKTLSLNAIIMIFSNRNSYSICATLQRYQYFRTIVQELLNIVYL